MSEDPAAPVRRSSRQRALAEKKKLEESDVRLYFRGGGGGYFDIFVTDINNTNDSYLILYKKCLQAKVDYLQCIVNKGGKFMLPFLLDLLSL